MYTNAKRYGVPLQNLLRATVLLVNILLAASAMAAAQQSLPAYPVIVTSAPFSARFTTTTYEKLADGTQIAHESETWEVRNSQGWQWSKRIAQNQDVLRRDGKFYTWYIVWDPIHHIRTEWCECKKIAYFKSYGDPLPERPRHPIPPEGMDVYLATGPATGHLKYHVTSIPGQILQGEPTEGTEAVRLVKAGLDGNDRDLRWSVKSWYSTRLHVATATITDDPLKGLWKYEALDLKTTEPDPKIFQVPEGYQILPAPQTVR